MFAGVYYLKEYVGNFFIYTVILSLNIEVVTCYSAVSGTISWLFPLLAVGRHTLKNITENLVKITLYPLKLVSDYIIGRIGI